MTVKTTVAERFWAKVDRRGPDECWPWLGSKITSGYGNIRYGYRTHIATHVVLELVLGLTVPKGMRVCHSCDNPECVNPAHLWIGTDRDNVRDSWAKGRGRVADNRGERNGQAKLTESQVREIRQMYADGKMSQRAIARLYGVGQDAISKIVRRKGWKCVA
jgi:hypothetical protein